MHKLTFYEFAYSLSNFRKLKNININTNLMYKRRDYGKSI